MTERAGGTGIDPQRGPIFFIGFPRSGTTVTFEAFCRHPELGWPSGYTESFPGFQAADGLRRLLDNSLVRLSGQKGQYGKTRLGNRFLPQPNEAYGFWDRQTGIDFARDFLRGATAGAECADRVRTAVRRLLSWQGRRRFAAKLTGPPRITFLDSIFPDGRFVHVVRDGRAAVHSLLRVGFWREKGGLTAPFWRGGLSDEQVAGWRGNGADPGVLAALQWTAVLEASRSEGERVGDRYRELRYEDFVADPHGMLRELYAFCGLDDAADGHRYLERNPPLAKMNDKYRQDFSSAYIDDLSRVMQPHLKDFGYPD